MIRAPIGRTMRAISEPMLPKPAMMISPPNGIDILGAMARSQRALAVFAAQSRRRRSSASISATAWVATAGA